MTRVAEETNILLIDEDPMVRQSLSYALEFDGYRVFPAANRQEAVSHIGKSEIHVLLMDASPRSGNPRETFDCLTKLRPNLPVIAMTSRPERDAENASAPRYNALFEKPLDFPCLVATIRRIV
jgi:DNA-binding NtrC family response regulator